MLFTERPIASTIVVGATTTLGYVLCIVFYRLLFHPLRKFPGPKLTAATFLYESYFDVFQAPGGQYIYQVDRLHDLYGPVIRISPEEVHVRDSQWFDVLYTGSGQVRNKWERSNRANGSSGSVASTVQHELHRARRGAINPFFSKRAVTQLESKVRSVVDMMCEKLGECAKDGRIVDIGAAFTGATLDVISEYCYDQSYNCLEEPNFAPQWKRLMKKLFEAVPMRNFPVVVTVMESLPPAIIKRLLPDINMFMEARESVSKQSKSVREELKDDGAKEPDTYEKPQTILDGIMHSNLPPEEKTVEHLTDEAFVLVVAGGETTAMVSTVITVELLRNPDILKRLRKELDSVMKAGLPKSRVLEEVPLMKAVVQEGLRIASPVTNRPIEIAPNEDLSCNGWVIPRGVSSMRKLSTLLLLTSRQTPISMTFRDVLFDPAIFPEPHRFDPDRWLRAADRGERLDRFLVTFSKGSRSCVRINLAYAEIYLCIAALFQQFDLELYDFDYGRDLEIVRDCFVGLPSGNSKGVRVRLRPRAG